MKWLTIPAAALLIGSLVLGIARGTADEAKGSAIAARVVTNLGIPHDRVRAAMDAAKTARDQGSPQDFDELVAAELGIPADEVQRAIEEARNSIRQ